MSLSASEIGFGAIGVVLAVGCVCIAGVGVIRHVEIVLRKEIESLKDLRSVMSRRLSSVDAFGCFDFRLEVDVAAAMFFRLLDAGVVEPSDLEVGLEAHRPYSEGGTDVKLVRARLKIIFLDRIKNREPALTAVEVASTEQFLDDLTGFVVEVAAYRRAYLTLCECVVEDNTRYQKLRVPPSVDRSDRLDRRAYRQDDPEVVLADALKTAAEMRGRISWARGKLRRLKYDEMVPPTDKKKRGRPKSLRAVAGPNGGVEYRSLRSFFRLLQDPAVEKRLAKLRCPPDLLRDAGLEDQSSSAID